MEVVKITFEDLKSFPNQSVTGWCRDALKKGMNPNARVEVYRDGKPNWDLAVKSIADGSKLTIVEDSIKGPYFAEYRPYTGPR